MEKYFIKNRKGQNISVLLEKNENQKGLAFVMHGLSGIKEAPHIATIAEAFKEKGFTVVRFDTTNTFGESDGKYEDATVTNYYEDLEDVIEASTLESWYQEPFCLAGHSLGGICSILYAENHPERILALAPAATVISGKLHIEANEKRDPEGLREWQRTGWQIAHSVSRPGVVKRLNWHSFIDDLMKYDVLVLSKKLSMPVLLVVGDEDDGTPSEHQKLLFDQLPGPKEFHVIKGAPHTYKEERHLKEIKDIFLKWIDTLIE